MHTKIFSGIRKKFMIVLLASSGMYWDLIFIIDGQNIPTHASKIQKPKSCIEPSSDMLPPFTPDGGTKNCFRKGINITLQHFIGITQFKPTKSTQQTYCGNNRKEQCGG